MLKKIEKLNWDNKGFESDIHAEMDEKIDMLLEEVDEIIDAINEMKEEAMNDTD